MSIHDELYTKAAETIVALHESMNAGVFDGIRKDLPIWWTGDIQTDGEDLWFKLSYSGEAGRRTMWSTEDGETMDDVDMVRIQDERKHSPHKRELTTVETTFWDLTSTFMTVVGTRQQVVHALEKEGWKASNINHAATVVVHPDKTNQTYKTIR